MSHDIMIDLETLGTTADAVILSIGAVRFDLDACTVLGGLDNTFYQVITIDSQTDRHISADTLAWWMQQSKAAQEVFYIGRFSLRDALLGLSEWIDPRPGAMPNVWSNGADFDLPILNHAYRTEQLTSPWMPYAGRCYRTYKNLPGARAIKLERTGDHHNALDDAIYQARHLCAIHAALFTNLVEVAA